MKICIANGRVITPFRTIEQGGVMIEGNKISEVFSGDPPVSGPEIKSIDAEGMYIAPGFIDMHVHGGGGSEIIDGTPEAVAAVCRTHARFGTTAIVPTVSSAPWDKLLRAVYAVKEAKESCDTSAAVLGIHVEGPYFSSAQRGAQNPDFIVLPDPRDYLKLLDSWEGIIMMGASPELPGGLELGRELRKRGILACIAHSDATYDEVLLALENGYTHITHFYSGCSMMRREHAYRIAGIVESGYLMDELTVEIIADGKHLPESLLKLIYKVKGPVHTALVTDATSYAGLDIEENREVKHRDGRTLILEDGVMKLSDRSNFAGSVANTSRLVRNMVRLAEVPLIKAVEMASYTPARILKVNGHKGSLSVGKDADVVIFDDSVNVKMTIVEGTIVHDARD